MREPPQTPAFVWAEEVSHNVRVYHSRLRLLDPGIQVTAGACGAMEFVNGQPLDGVLELVLSIPGVAQAKVTAYALTVEKSPVFHWAEIDAHLANLFLGVPLALGCEETGLEDVDRDSVSP